MDSFSHFKHAWGKAFSAVAMFALLSSSFAPLLAFPAAVSAATPVVPTVAINEFSSNGSSDWVELYNTDLANAVDISGWNLSDSTSVMKTFASSTSIAAGGFLVEEVGSRLNDKGDTITLFDGSTTPVAIDTVAYGTSGIIPVPGIDQSAFRTPDGGATWDVTATPTKGVSNLDPLPQPYLYPSTNANDKTAGHGYVEEESAAADSVTLKFVNPNSYVMCFEYRSDGDTSQKLTNNGGNNYNTNVHDGLYPHYCLSNETQTHTISANKYVEVRSTFGAERDTDFDWTQFDVATAPDLSGVAFVNDPKYVRINNSTDVDAQLVAPTSVTAVHFFVDGSTTPITGINIGGAGATTDWWRLLAPLAEGTHTVTAQAQVSGNWYAINDSALVYVLGNPTGSFIIPSTTNNVFRPSDNPLRVSVGDANDTFRDVVFHLGGTNYQVNRAQCDVREAGNRVLCDIDAATNWTPLVEGTYSATATLYNVASDHTSLTSLGFTIDATRPVLTNFVLDPVSSTYNSSVTASADATDANGIQNVTFSVTAPRAGDGVCNGNGTPLMSDVATTSAGTTYTSALALNTLTNGDYCVNAVAEDVAASHSLPQSLKITVAHPVDTQSPTAQFSPIPAKYVNGNFHVAGTAADNMALKNVFFDVRDPSAVGNQWKTGCVATSTVVTYSNASTTAAISCDINTSNLTEGHTYVLRIHAGDFAGYGGGQQQNLVLDVTRPTATITAPADASAQFGSFTITGTATDTLSGIDHVNIYVSKVTPPDGNGKTFGGYVVNNQPATWNAALGTFSYDVSGVADGAYLIKAVAFDKAGNSHFASPVPAIAVVNSVPNLAITAPAVDGATVSGTYAFTAEYDNGVTNSLSWAIRKGNSCSNSSGTVLGNVDGHHDAGSLSGTTFSTAAVDTTTWTAGQYCFVVNDNHGHRPTRVFSVDNAPVLTPSVTTGAASNITATDATLNGTNGAFAADQESFWVSTSTFDTSSPNIPANVWSTPVLPPVASSTAFSNALSLVTTNGIVTGGVNSNMPAITASTTYYYVAWVHVNGTWYPGAVQSFTTAPSITQVANSIVVKMEDLASNFSDALAHPSKWFFWDDNTNVINNALGSFVSGPATTTEPLHNGSAQIGATAGDRIALASGLLAGTELKDISSLSYSTYRSVGTPALDLALQFDINTAGTTTPTAYEGRLVYEPYFTNTVADNTWQTWNPMTGANWWFSRAGSSVSTSCAQATPCTWAQVLAAFPNIGVTSGTYFRAGQWSNDFTGNVDNFVVGVKNGSTVTTTTYDFEPTPPTAPVESVSHSGGGVDSIVGDLNHDGKVDILDLALMMTAFNHLSVNPSADLNNDKAVNVADLAILLSHWTGR